MKSSVPVPTRRRFLLNVLPAGTVCCLGSLDSGYSQTTKEQSATGDARVKALWNEGLQFMQRGYT
jgi:hypothetical protein